MQPPFFVHTIIIGAGQSGLVTAYYLKKKNIDHFVLDEGSEVGQSWMRRYDSLKLFTNIRHNSLDGFVFPGERNKFPTKYETATYLKQYAAHFNLSIRFGEKVIKLEKNGDFFHIETIKGFYQSKNVIVCTGAFHTPFVPDYGKKIHSDILQIHSRDYTNSSQLKKGKIVVVGGGNSGVQIAEELVNEGKEVYFSYRDPLKRVPNHPLIVWFIFATGFVYASKNNFIGKYIMNNGEVIIGTDLKELFKKNNLVQTGALVNAAGVEFQFERLKINDIQNVIWATGYKPDFNWIQLPILDNHGNPITDYGVTQVKGLYFVGLGWQRSRASWLIGGVSRDAKYITEKIKD